MDRNHCYAFLPLKTQFTPCKQPYLNIIYYNGENGSIGRPPPAGSGLSRYTKYIIFNSNSQWCKDDIHVVLPCGTHWWQSSVFCQGGMAERSLVHAQLSVLCCPTTVATVAAWWQSRSDWTSEPPPEVWAVCGCPQILVFGMPGSHSSTSSSTSATTPSATANFGAQSKHLSFLTIVNTFNLFCV